MYALIWTIQKYQTSRSVHLSLVILNLHGIYTYHNIYQEWTNGYKLFIESFFFFFCENVQRVMAAKKKCSSHPRLHTSMLGEGVKKIYAAHDGECILGRVVVKKERKKRVTSRRCSAAAHTSAYLPWVMAH